MSNYAEEKALNMKKLRRFIASKPEGATHAEIKAAGISFFGLDSLKRAKAIQCVRVAEPERGPKAFHWLYKVTPMRDLGEGK